MASENGLAALVGKDRITAEDVLAARASRYPDMTISPDEAEALFKANDTAHSTAPQWRELFVEALSDYVVKQADPPGYVDAGKARWLAERISQDGRIKSDTELELLIQVLEKATEVPAALSTMALERVASFALTPERQAGDGPTLTGEEVNRLRRVVYAFAGDGGPAGVSRNEAAILFRLNEAARGRPNDPAWRELFVHAIGGALLTASGYAPQGRDEAKRLQTWLQAPSDGIGGLLAKSFAALAHPGAGLAAAFEEDPLTEQLHKTEAAQAEAAPLTGDEADWLIAQIGRDGMLDDNEKALLRFVAEQASTVSPTLQALIARAAPAAQRAAS